MRKLKLVMLTLLLLVSAVACKKDDNSAPNTSSVLNSSLQQGSWRVTSLISSGTDETNHFAGYTFQFSANGNVAAVNSGSTTNGTWSTGTDDSQLKLVLNFGSTSPFQELNNDWHVLQQSTTLIKLEDVSGGNGGTDTMTLEKN